MLFNPTFQSNSYLNAPSNKGLFRRFHCQFVKTFNPLPSHGKFQEVATRIATVAIAPFVYLAWSIQLCSHILFRGSKYSFQKKNRAISVLLSQKKPLIGPNLIPSFSVMKNEESTQTQNFDSHSFSVHDEIDPSYTQSKASPKKDLQSKLDSMQIIKKSRFDDVSLELERLRKNGILSNKIESIIDEISLDLKKTLRIFALKDFDDKEMKMILSRALEIKKLFQETHYIFTHSQNAQWLAVSCFIKELVKCFDSSKNIHHFKFLRPPLLVNQNKSDALPLVPVPYFKDVNNVRYDHNPIIKESLLSVDAYLFNAKLGESALYFLSQNASLSFPNLSIFRSILLKFMPPDVSLSQLEILAKKIQSLIKKYYNLFHTSKLGNLFVICVPKADIDNSKDSILYRAHAYGIPCNCHEDNRAIKILEELQNNEVKTESLCKEYPPIVPQYRLRTEILTPENGVHSFLLTSFNKSEKKSLKKEIAKIAAEAYQLSMAKLPI